MSKTRKGTNMTGEELIGMLRARGVDLDHRNGRLLLNAPSGVLDEDLRRAVRACKAELIALLEAEQDSRDALPDGMQPLSSAQQSMWYLESEHAGQGLYNLYLCLRIAGPLRVDALESALNALLERHEMLRGRVLDVNGQFALRIEPHATVTLPIENAPDDEVALHERLLRELARDFEPEREMMFRCRLFRVDAREHVLMLCIDHVLVDGESMEILRTELAELYAAAIERREARLPALRMRYADFVREERRWLDTPAAASQLEYWKRQLGGALEPLELPTDHPRPPAPTGRGDMLRAVLDETATARLRETAQRSDASPFMLLTATAAALLRAVCAHERVLLGMPLANRARAERDNVVGLFMNPAAIALSVSNDAPFTDLLAAVRRRCVEALENQALPFDRIVEALRPARDPGRAPTFQVMVAWVPAAERRFSAGGCQWQPLTLNRGTAQADLVFWWRETDGGLAVDLEYNTDVIARTTARSLLHSFEQLLAAAVADPERSIGSLPLLTENERGRVEAWGRGPVRACADTALNMRVRAQCERTPTAIAVQDETRKSSYADVLALADRVRGALHATGQARGGIVGVLLDRDVRLPAALLGVLDAGAAYLPLDPDAPVARLSWLLEDAGATHVITDTAMNSGGLPDALANFKGRIIDLAALDSVAAGDGNARAPYAADAADPAYVIYTSGSTGKPKGVVVPHGAVNNFLDAMQELFGTGTDDVFLALTNLSFDIAALELWLPLATGARIAMVSRSTGRDADALRRYIETVRPTLVQATPAGWQWLLDAGWRGDSRLLALSGGEALPVRLAHALRERVRELWNLYGPTETTVWSTAHRVNAGDEPVPIGRPIANTTVHVLDAARRPLPAGMPGELYIGGAGVTSGYLNRPALTAERFVEHPEYGRIYRTGDRVRFDAHGRLEYLGRVDFQIKLRGQRIEPGEIEAVLQSHPAVSRAVVVVCELRGDRRLAAYITLAAGKRASVAQLREHLAAELPAYMLPQHFVELEAMPLTASGKIDRKALPSPVAVPRSEGKPPVSHTERRIAAIWRDVLGVERVCVDDNFFDLGGHSLLSMKVIARIHEELGPRLRPRLLVLNTLAEIAAACDSARDQEAAPAQPPRQKGMLQSVMNSLLGRV